ncbi:uncharacterized protein Bfra_010571 [Botrytis fragariae]|uniref:Uncharacterized protein n=1 Tax=Botrytis fragariae TaxID=1964551 RepID=A0A8H6AGB1_9HELO|nr:uncharacterized protein Bfra_010571 [Botrytis fragariae]KAF5867596.1 hypothetical protein Bfra_010571 [Botrytis fragariae]
MEEMTLAELVANISKYDLAQTLHKMPIIKANSDAVAMDLQIIRRIILDIEEQARCCIENYQRASQKKKQILEPNLREGLKSGERALLEFKQCQTDLEAAEMRCIAADEMIRKHLKSLTYRLNDIKCGLVIQFAGGGHGHYIERGHSNFSQRSISHQSLSLLLSPSFKMLPKRTACEMTGSSGKAEDGPLKRMKEILKENVDKVTFSNRETSQFECLVLVNKKDIESHRSNIKRWEKYIQDSEKLIRELEETNREYKEDIEKNRQETVKLEQEEEVILAIQKQENAREKALQKFIQRDITRFLEGELKKVGLSLEKESEGGQDEKIAGDGEKKMVKNEI